VVQAQVLLNVVKQTKDCAWQLLPRPQCGLTLTGTLNCEESWGNLACSNGATTAAATVQFLGATGIRSVSMTSAGLQKVWKSGRSFPGNRTCSREINQLQVKWSQIIRQELQENFKTDCTNFPRSVTVVQYLTLWRNSYPYLTIVVSCSRWFRAGLPIWHFWNQILKFTLFWDT